MFIIAKEEELLPQQFWPLIFPIWAIMGVREK